MIYYKAFNKNFQCKGFQYEVGKTYHYPYKIEICERGFHAVKDPLDVWSYYPLDFDTRWAIVEISGEIEEHSGDSKIVGSIISIIKELSFNEYLEEIKKYYSKLAASGVSSKLAASGVSSKLAASGVSSKLAASGNSSELAASGDSSTLAASGNYSKLAASGNYSKLAASGDSSTLATSGGYSKLAASGNYSKLAASGVSSKLAASGDSSVIISSGINSIAKGKKGTWISLAEFDNNSCCIGFATGCIGFGGLEENVYYKAQNGKLIKV